MIYLDHNATTPVLPEVVDAMLPWLTTQWGNPSSVHLLGRQARQALEEARAQLASLVGSIPEQILFTSSATESINSAIHSAILHNPKKRHIVTSSVEHSAVLAYCEYLEHHHQVEVTRLPVDRHGMLSASELRNSIRADTGIVSLMWANNETGVVWPITDFAAICAERDVPFHTDAVQAIGKIQVGFQHCGASFLSLSGHKFGAPKGIGALIIKDPRNFVPFLVGGKQEYGRRAGTENVANIVAIGMASDIAKRELQDWDEVVALRCDFERSFIDLIPGTQINGSGSLRLPNTSSIYIPKVDGDALVTFLDQRGICISSGSACMESAIAPSHVILAMTSSHEQANESVRISLGKNTTFPELRSLIGSIQQFYTLTT